MTRERLLEDLRALGLRPGHLLMVHASLRRIGLASSQVGEGGAELLLDALEEAVGPDGTLLMVLGCDYPQDWVNQRPLEERAALLAGTAPLDPLTAPALPEVGWLAERFRLRPGTLVTGNPSGRFGARGRRAEDLLRDAPWHDYYGPRSPLERLCGWGGGILRLGADPDTVTALHHAEYLARLPDKRRTRWDFLIADPRGPRHAWVECLDDQKGIVPWEGEDYFAIILRSYLAQGRHAAGQVGSARSELLDADDLVHFGAVWMEENLGR